MTAAKISIDLTALKHNFSRVKDYAPKSKVLAMVKANAYGHGLIPIANALNDADGFGVARLEEAQMLRRAGVQKTLVLMSGFSNDEELHQAMELKCDVVVHSLYQVQRLKTDQNRCPNVWLKLDTGMHRLGLNSEEYLNAIKTLANIKVIMTHFSDADNPACEKTKKQIQDFFDLTKEMNTEKSLANSAGIIGFREAHAEWVRPGIMLYGASPIEGKESVDFNLKPVMTFEGALVAEHYLKKGDTIGYGSRWVCPEDMPVGVVSVGYGDGYPRTIQENTPVLINEKLTIVLGRVSMDLLMIDLRNIPNSRVGNGVILWGKGLPVERIAKSAGTISYELFTRMTGRVERVFSKA